ncbi:alpha/beta hydrolase [Chloroflexi bacterium]|nr:alpha/beta hydrolase [Chloroflexota bacterium]
MQDSGDISIGIVGMSEWDIPDNQVGRGLTLQTTRGPINTLVHHDPKKPSHRGIIWVGGARGGLDGPAGGLYKILGSDLAPGITSLRIDYRNPGELIECVMDTLAGVSFLTGTGHTDILLVGHSFGGAVVIKAAPFSDHVKGVVALSSQTFGATDVSDVSPRPILLIHGEDDTVLSPQCSQTIFDWADEPKEVIFLPGTGHGLRETSQEATEKVKLWVMDHLYLPDESA